MKIIFLGLTCAATGSYSMTFFKCGAEVVSSTDGWWRNLELYALAAVALGIVAVQITSMNQGLRHADVVIVIPTFFALGVLFSLIQAQLAFGELNELKGLQNIIIFGAGVVLAHSPRGLEEDLQKKEKGEREHREKDLESRIFESLYRYRHVYA